MNKIIADERTNSIVFGFCRKVEALLHSMYYNDPFYNIPDLVISLILHYFFIADHFDLIGPSSSVSDDKYSIMRGECDGWADTCYGHTIIPSTTRNMIYKWYLKIISLPQNHTMIGIASEPFPDYAIYLSSKGYHYFCWSHDGKVSSQSTGWKQYGSRFTKGDNICVILEFNDGKDATLSYDINDKSQGIAFHVQIAEDIDYRLAISLCGHGAKITLEKLEIIQK